jgi:hypothetical protein
MSDTSPIFSQSMFPYLNIDEKLTLKIKIELGYLVVNPRSKIFHSYIFDNVQNFYYPTPGGKQGNSFIYNDAFKKQKSDSLRQTTTGVMPKHIDIQGAPYCTFIDGSLIPNQVHPYYDLIKAPPDVTNYNPSTYAQFNQNSSFIQENYQSKLGNAQQAVQQTGKVGSIYIPATTKTGKAIADLKFSPHTTYNVWKIDGFIPTSFTNIGYLGFYPNSGENLANLQPYAQTWPYTTTAGIQVYASSSQVSLTRMYPMYKDIAHDPDINYVIFNNAVDINTFENSPNQPLQYQNIGLSNGTQPVGFTLQIDSVLTNTIPASSISTVSYSEPKILITWGAVDLNSDQINQSYTSKKKIGLYTLDLTPGTSPKLYYNLSTQEILQSQRDLNLNSVEIENLKSLEVQQTSSGVKYSNQYKLYVYYMGSFLYLGNDPDPNTWSAVSSWNTLPNVALGIATNADQTANIKKEEYDHWLDEKSKINIYAQFMNFIFYYGPPLFSPYDKDNKTNSSSEDPTQYLKNTLNQISTITKTTLPEEYSNDPSKYARVIEKQIKESLIYDSAGNFDKVNSRERYGGASIYYDIRSNFDATVNSGGFSKLKVKVEYLGMEPADYGMSTFGIKITLPSDLGGHNYVKYYDNASVDDPDITQSYAFYDLKDEDPSINISNILTSALTRLSITKGIQDSPSATLNQKASLDFINLNRSKAGNKILQFMRNNVAVIKISAGYGSEMNVFFEGAINAVKVNEFLEKTEIHIEAEDLLAHLFERKETCIISRTRINFFGMKFYQLIKELVYYTELNNHFKFDLGTTKDLSIYYNMTRKDTDLKIPPVPSLANNSNISNLYVGAYNSDQTYISVLKKIIPLMLQGPSQAQGVASNLPFDIPLLYWYAGTKNNKNVDGIVMSSRNIKSKDRDKFFIKRASAMNNKGGALQITDLHGTVFADGSTFSSDSESLNLQTIGLYRAIGINQEPIYSQAINYNAILLPVNINTQGYIGYNRTLIFDSANENFTGGMPPTLIPDQQTADAFVLKYMSTVFNSIYENISLKAIVTKPLKEWGHFALYFENDNYALNEGTDDSYLYGQVQYDFKINENLIVASINGAKKPIQGAK